MPSSSQEARSPGSSSSPDDQPRIKDVDLQALAEELYKLLQKELRLERERRGLHRVW